MKSMQNIIPIVATITGIALTIFGCWDYPNNNTMIMSGSITTIISAAIMLSQNLINFKVQTNDNNPQKESLGENKPIHGDSPINTPATSPETSPTTPLPRFD